MKKPMCILSLDFQGMFDPISHNYLESVLLTYGFGERMVRRLMNLYEGASSTIQINGYTSPNICIKSSIHQGCPLSMLIYSFCINPLLTALHEALPGVHIDRRKKHTSVLAYADDVSIFITSPADIPKVRDVIGCYAKAPGTTINTTKSKILALGTWDTRLNILDVPYKDTLTILGMKLSNYIALSSEPSWAQTTAKIKAKAQNDYSRILNFDKRVRFIHEQLYAYV
jgi:hypothetical protein